MAAAAQRAPSWIGGFRDVAREHGYQPLEVEGTLPRDLVGTLVRNGPGKFGVAGERYRHWFDGDGVVRGVRLEGGRAFGAVRTVRTRGLVREERAGKRLFGAYDTPLARPLRELLLRDRKNPANTSILAWQERLFATCEAGLPYEIDRDLHTVGETDLGVIRGAFSAHPHRVPSRRCTFNFGLDPTFHTIVRAYALPDEGRPRELARFTLDGTRLQHDFAVTEHHLVFFFAPMYLSVTSMLRGRGPASSTVWRPERGSEIVVVPIDRPQAMRRFRTDAFMLEHVVNAFEEGDELVVDHTHYARPWDLEGFVRGLVRGEVEAPARGTIRRARIRGSRMTTELLVDRALELPRISPRVETARHRFAYYAGGASEGEGAPFEAVIKHDLERATFDVYAPGPEQYAGEAVFVPREGGSAEDDGWLLTMVYDARSDRSRLDVLDARAPSNGPLAKCWFDHPVPYGVHGIWVA